MFYAVLRNITANVMQLPEGGDKILIIFNLAQMTKKAQNIIKALNPRFWVGAVTCRFFLRSGDNVFVSVFNGRRVTKQAKVKGFTAYGIHYENHYINWHHYCNGLFYGFGYHNEEYAIVTTKKRHIPFAWLCEKLRLSISEKWAIRLGLQNDR